MKPATVTVVCVRDFRQAPGVLDTPDLFGATVPVTTLAADKGKRGDRRVVDAIEARRLLASGFWTVTLL